MKKRLGIIAIVLVIIFNAAACSKPDAVSLADKINLDYAIKLTDIGIDDASKYKEFMAESSVEFSGEGISATENYVVKFNKKNGQPNAYVSLTTCERDGIYTTKTIEAKFFEDSMQEYVIENGQVASHSDVKYPDRISDGGSRLDDFKLMFMRHAMPGEVFISDQLEDLKAVKKSNRIVVTAKAKQEYLEVIRQAYYKTYGSGSFEVAPYGGPQKLERFDSVEYAYSIKNGRIADKKIIIKGRGHTATSEGLLFPVDLTVTQTVWYTYSVNMSAPNFID